MDAEDEDQKSRTQMKREFQELKDLVTQLVELSAGQLARIPLAERTREGMLTAKGLSRSALQRQLRRLVRFIADEDVDAIRLALAGAPHPETGDVPAPPDAPDEAERWCEELVAGDDDLMGRFIETYPASDRQHLRQLVRNARAERDLDKPPASAPQLLSYLQDLLPEER